MPTRRHLLALGAAAMVPRAAHAQAGWAPTRNVVMVVPYPAGGNVDVLARIVAREIGPELGQTVIVENQAGASGSIGARRVGRAEPDGHTLLLTTNQTHATNLSLLPDGGGYDPVRDFTPLAGIADLQHLLVTRADLGVADVAGLLALARSAGRELTCASTGLGSASHLAMELFKARTGVALVHVAYRGAAPLLQDLVGGRVDLSFATTPTVIGQVDGGQLKALAVASATGCPQAPRLPTLAAAGVAGVEADAWTGLFGPAGLPPAIRDRYASLVAAALARPSVRDAIAVQGMNLNPRGPDAFAAFQREEITRWAAIIKAAGVQPEKP